MTVQIPRVGPRLAAAAGAFLVLVLVAGCSGGAESGTAPAPEESASPSPEPPALSEPIDLDYSGHVLTDDGRDRALLVDWSNGQLRAIDNQGTELWAERVQLDDEMMSAPVAYSSGDIVIIDDQASAHGAVHQFACRGDGLTQRDLAHDRLQHRRVEVTRQALPGRQPPRCQERSLRLSKLAP